MSENGSQSFVDSSTPASALPPGTRLSEFEILRVLGVGGFGIVYLAFDHALEREVAVKEYMPASMAGRTETLHVSLRSKSDSEIFALGLRSFVNEAKLLARFDHPSLLKVHRFWEGNGTAYMAMPVLRGQTLKDVRQQSNPPPDEAWLREKLVPLLDALERLHVEGVYHRDIAPDNILIEPDGHPVLLDFGAARRVISDKTQSLTAILKPAYAPIEQYAESGSVKQGPWTDFYALGATLHYMLLGQPPAPATSRAVMDDHTPLAGQRLAGCDPAFLRVVDWMLAPRPLDRPQNVAELREALAGQRPPGRLAALSPAPAAWAEPEFDPDATMVRSVAPLLPPVRPAVLAPTAPAGRPTAAGAAEAPWAASTGAVPTATEPLPAAAADATRVSSRPAAPMPPSAFPATLAAAARNAAAMPPAARAPAPPVLGQPVPTAFPPGPAAPAPATPHAAFAAAPIESPIELATTFPIASPVAAPEAAPSDLDRLRAPASAAAMAPLAAASKDATPSVAHAPHAGQAAAKAVPAAGSRSKALPMALGAVVALGVAAFAFWPQGTPTGSASPAAPMSAPAPSVAATAPEAVPNPSPVALNQPSPAGAVLPASEATAAAVSASAPALADATSSPATSTTAAPSATGAAAAVAVTAAAAVVAPPAVKPTPTKPPVVKPPVTKPAVAEAAKPSDLIGRAGAAGGNAAPVNAGAGAGGNAIIKPPVYAPSGPANAASPTAPPNAVKPQAPPEAPSKPAPILGPEAVCAGKTLFKRFGCMESECLRAEQQSHLDCKEWRKNRPAHGT
jgi:serine/threonine protein kinase